MPLIPSEARGFSNLKVWKDCEREVPRLRELANGLLLQTKEAVSPVEETLS
jgi:hypothetical protein